MKNICYKLCFETNLLLNILINIKYIIVNPNFQIYTWITVHLKAKKKPHDFDENHAFSQKICNRNIRFAEMKIYCLGMALATAVHSAWWHHLVNLVAPIWIQSPTRFAILIQKNVQRLIDFLYTCMSGVEETWVGLEAHIMHMERIMFLEMENRLSMLSVLFVDLVKVNSKLVFFSEWLTFYIPH